MSKARELTEEQSIALDHIAIEIAEFAEMCIRQEPELDEFKKYGALFSVLLRCLQDEINCKTGRDRVDLSIRASEEIRGCR